MPGTFPELVWYEHDMSLWAAMYLKLAQWDVTYSEDTQELSWSSYR